MMDLTQRPLGLAIDRIRLHEVIMGPINYPIGEAYQVLRPPMEVTIVGKEQVSISPRVKERCLLLDNDERIIVTERRGIDVPVDVDGVLWQDADDNYIWQSHRLIAAAEQIVVTRGVTDLADSATHSWTDAVRYIAEKSPGAKVQDRGLRPPQLERDRFRFLQSEA